MGSQPSLSSATKNFHAAQPAVYVGHDRDTAQPTCPFTLYHAILEVGFGRPKCHPHL
jgi:hypothetical protein